MIFTHFFIFIEPEISAAGKAVISGEVESLSVALSPSQSHYDNLHLLVDSDSNVYIISREDDKYYSYKVCVYIIINHNIFFYNMID